jgi:hypothetical protein
LQLNDEEQLYLSSSEFLAILKEDGQVIDLDAAMLLSRQPLFKIIIQDGSSVDILGRGKLLPSDVLGAYQTSDPKSDSDFPIVCRICQQREQRIGADGIKFLRFVSMLFVSPHFCR